MSRGVTVKEAMSWEHINPTPAPFPKKISFTSHTTKLRRRTSIWKWYPMTISNLQNDLESHTLTTTKGKPINFTVIGYITQHNIPLTSNMVGSISAIALNFLTRQ